MFLWIMQDYNYKVSYPHIFYHFVKCKHRCFLRMFNERIIFARTNYVSDTLSFLFTNHTGISKLSNKNITDFNNLYANTMSSSFML